MKESKIELTERLRREGRWEEASRFKDDTVKRLRGEGTKRAEAADAAWDAMAEKYPPLPPAEPKCPEPPPEVETDDSDLDVLAARVEGSPPDLVRDTLWAYENLENKQARPEDAPSVGAWSLLKWARDYRNRFFEQLVPRAMAARAKQEETSAEADVDPGLDEVRTLLEGIRQQMEESLATDVPAVVQHQVGGVLSEWCKRFGVTLPDGAAESLRLHVVGVAKNCIKATLRHPERFAALHDKA